MSDDERPSEEGTGTVGGYTDLTFCVFPSLEPTPESEAAAAVQQSNGVYVPWELTAAPWQRLAKRMHQKYLVGMLARGEPAVLVLQTNHAPEHPNRAALRSKTLLSWMATELDVAGEVRLVLRARVEGAGFTMEQQVSAAQEAQARAGGPGHPHGNRGGGGAYLRGRHRVSRGDGAGTAQLAPIPGGAARRRG